MNLSTIKVANASSEPQAANETQLVSNNQRISTHGQFLLDLISAGVTACLIGGFFYAVGHFADPNHLDVYDEMCAVTVSTVITDMLIKWKKDFNFSLKRKHALPLSMCLFSTSVAFITTFFAYLPSRPYLKYIFYTTGLSAAGMMNEQFSEYFLQTTEAFFIRSEHVLERRTMQFIERVRSSTLTDNPNPQSRTEGDGNQPVLRSQI
jgi:hypothetical protein